MGTQSTWGRTFEFNPLTNKSKMIKLRLKRFGKKRETSFRLVACNSTSRRDGRPLQELGFYNPRTKETRLDTEALRTRLGQGAQPSLMVQVRILRLESRAPPAPDLDELIATLLSCRQIVQCAQP